VRRLGDSSLRNTAVPDRKRAERVCVNPRAPGAPPDEPHRRSAASETAPPRLSWRSSALLSSWSVLDVSIVNVAVPNIRRDLHLSQNGLAWVLNAYTLTPASCCLVVGPRTCMAGDALSSWAGAVHGGLVARGGSDRWRADRGPGRAGTRRGGALTRNLDDLDDHVPRAQGTHSGVGAVGCGRRRRGSDRRVGRRRAHRAAVVALDLVHQRANRTCRDRGGPVHGGRVP